MLVTMRGYCEDDGAFVFEYRELSCIMWNREKERNHFCFYCMDFLTVGLVGGTRFRY